MSESPTRTGLYWWLYAHWNCRRLPTFLGGTRRFLKWVYQPDRKTWVMLWKQHGVQPEGPVDLPYKGPFPTHSQEVLDDMERISRVYGRYLK